MSSDANVRAVEMRDFVLNARALLQSREQTGITGPRSSVRKPAALSRSRFIFVATALSLGASLYSLRSSIIMEVYRSIILFSAFLKGFASSL